MEEDRRKGFSTAWTLIPPKISCISEQSRDIQEVLSLIPHSKTIYWSERLRRLHLPHRERSRYALHHPGWIWFQEEVSKGQAVCVFHSREPDVRQARSGRSSIRSGQTQNRGVLSNTIARNRSFQHTVWDKDWESGIHEDRRGFILQSIPIHKVTARRAHAEFASWTSGAN